MKLAWLNLIHNRTRFVVTVLGIGFAVFLMVFQGSLLFGFIGAASRLVDSTDSELWLTARGVTCFDFPAAISNRIFEIAQGVNGIASAGRMVTSFAEYRKPGGEHFVTAVVGIEPGVASVFPIPHTGAVGDVVDPDAAMVDESNVALLGLGSLPAEVELNGRRARVTGAVSGFSSFLGCPYVFTSYANAVRYLGIRDDQTMYILLRLQRGFPPEEVKKALQARLPEVDVWTRGAFAQRSRAYWMTQTGAGAGILTAAVLGFIIGLVVVSQATYATTMENIEEFATLKAIGASSAFVVRLVLSQCLLFGAVGAALGLAAGLAIVHATKGLIAWIEAPWWLLLAAVPATVFMCALGGVASVRAALSVEPAKVFRA